MKTPLTFQIILMAACALVLYFATPPNSPSRLAVRKDVARNSLDDKEGVLTHVPLRDYVLTTAPTPLMQPSVNYDTTGRDSFIISNSGTIYMNDSGSLNAGATFNPVAPTWTPQE